MMISRDELKQEITKYHNLGWNIVTTTITRKILEDGSIDEVKVPTVKELKPYFDAKNRMSLEELLKHADTHENPYFALVNGKQPNGRFYISIDIDTKDEQVKKLVLTNIPLSLYQETRKGYHIFLEVEGDPNKIRETLENKAVEGLFNGKRIRIEFRIKDCITFFAGEGYGKLQGEMVSVPLEDINNAIRATLDAFNLCLMLQNHYYHGDRNDTIFRLSGILAKKRIPKSVALMIVDALCVFYKDEQKASRLQVTKNSYKAYENGEALNTRLEEILPADVSKKIYEYFNFRPNGNGKEEKEIMKKQKQKEKEKEEEKLVLKLIGKCLSELGHNAKILEATSITEVQNYEIKKIPLQIYTFLGKNTHLHYADKLFESVYADSVFTRNIKYDVNDETFYYFDNNHYKRFDGEGGGEDTLLKILYNYAVGYMNKAILRYYELKLRENELARPKEKEGDLLQIHEQLLQSEEAKGEITENNNNDDDEELRKVREELTLLQEIFNCYMSYVFDRSRLRKILDILKTRCSYSKDSDPHKDEYGYIIPFEDCYIYARIDGKEGKPILKVLNPSPSYFIKFVFPAKIRDRFNADCNNVNMDFVKSTALWKFMVDIANGDESLAYTLLVIIASSMIIQTKKRMFYIWKGSGNNGKSTLVKLLELTLEPIFGYIPVNALLIKDVKNSEEAPRPFLLNMKDKRIGVTSELKEQADLDSNIIKMITGSDTIPVRNLFDRRPTYVQPYFNLFMTTNPMPRINDKSLAMKDRFVVIEFTRRFEGEEVDKYILEKLLSNVDEIYLVLLEMLKVHLTRDVENVVKQCKAIMDTTKRYWYEQDGVQWYLDEYAVDTKDKENDIVYVSEVEDNIEMFYKEVLKKTPPSRETIRRLLRLKIPDDRFDYDIKKHRSLVLKGYKFKQLAVWRDGNGNDNEGNSNNSNKKNNNGDNGNASNGNGNGSNNNNSKNNSSNNTVTTTAVEPSEPTSAEESNKKHVEDNDRETLDKILFAIFSEENGGYFKCPICNDNIRYTSPYTLSQHVCYAHARNYGTFNANSMTVVKVQEFIRLLQKFYPITEDYGWTYFIRKLSNSSNSSSGNRNAV